MSTNPVMRYAMARGMGGLGAIDWDSIFDRGFDFGNTFLEQWGNRGAYEHGINPNAATTTAATGVTTAQLQALLAARDAAKDDDDGGSGLGISFTDKGLKLGSKTVISYPVMGIAALALMMIQSSGFQKRGK